MDVTTALRSPACHIWLGWQMNLLPHTTERHVMVRTIDTGGASPVSRLLEATRMIRSEHCQVVAVVAGDAVSSLPTAEFLERADQGCRDPAG